MKIADTSYVEDLFGNKKAFYEIVIGFGSKSLPVIGTKVGKIVGGEKFISKAISNFDRRGGKESMERKSDTVKKSSTVTPSLEKIRSLRSSAFYYYVFSFLIFKYLSLETKL